MPDGSYMKDTPETDRDMRVILERLMVAYPAAVPVAHLAAAIGKTENRISHYGTRIRARLSQGRVPLTMTTERGAARLHTQSVFSEHP
jgi:hypothetical protein